MYKTVFRRFLPCEYKELETYLEKMALKGWMIKGIEELSLRFDKCSPEEIKFLVTFEEDKELAEEICKICSLGNGYVYALRGGENHKFTGTTDEEKSKKAYKETKNRIIRSLGVGIGFGAAMSLKIGYGSLGAYYLADNATIFAALLPLFFLAFGLFDMLKTIILYNKRKKVLKSKENYINQASLLEKSIDILIYIIIGSIIALVLFMALEFSDRQYSFLIINAALIFLTIYLYSYVKVRIYKSKPQRVMANLIYFITIIAVLGGINFGLFSEEIKSGTLKGMKSEIPTIEYTLSDFVTEEGNEEVRYPRGGQGTFGSYVSYYENSIGKIEKGYDLDIEIFKGKYNWINNIYINDVKRYYKDIVDFNEIDENNNGFNIIVGSKKDNKSKYMYIINKGKKTVVVKDFGVFNNIPKEKIMDVILNKWK